MDVDELAGQTVQSLLQATAALSHHILLVCLCSSHQLHIKYTWSMDAGQGMRSGGEARFDNKILTKESTSGSNIETPHARPNCSGLLAPPPRF
eukprot:774827-Amphidinium_carterae.1